MQFILCQFQRRWKKQTNDKWEGSKWNVIEISDVSHMGLYLCAYIKRQKARNVKSYLGFVHIEIKLLLLFFFCLKSKFEKFNDFFYMEQWTAWKLVKLSIFHQLMKKKKWFSSKELINKFNLKWLLRSKELKTREKEKTIITNLEADFKGIACHVTFYKILLQTELNFSLSIKWQCLFSFIRLFLLCFWFENRVFYICIVYYSEQYVISVIQLLLHGEFCFLIRFNDEKMRKWETQYKIFIYDVCAQVFYALDIYPMYFVLSVDKLATDDTTKSNFMKIEFCRRWFSVFIFICNITTAARKCENHFWIFSF